MKLSEAYHCIFILPLLSFPFSRDFLTIWKRTKMINMKEEEEENDNEDDDEWANISENERIFNSERIFVAKEYEHLLEE